MEFFALGLLGIATASLWLSVYVAGLYFGGKRLANSRRWTHNLKDIAFGVALMACLIASLSWLLPMPNLIRAFTALGLWILHAPPFFMGYWSGVEAARMQDEAQWTENAKRWIQEWEDDAAPSWIRALGEGSRDEGTTND